MNYIYQSDVPNFIENYNNPHFFQVKQEYIQYQDLQKQGKKGLIENYMSNSITSYEVYIFISLIVALFLITYFIHTDPDFFTSSILPWIILGVFALILFSPLLMNFVGIIFSLIKNFIPNIFAI